MKKLTRIIFIFSGLMTAASCVQADMTPSPNSTTQPLPTAPTPTNTNAAPADGGPLVDDKVATEAKSLLPTVDPKTETVAWDGGTWKVENNRIFRSQFVKYLNDPEETDKASTQYEAILAQIQQLLTPGQATDANVDQAWKLLFEAAKFRADSQLCNDIADAVYALWQCRSEQNHLATANDSIRSEEQALAWNMEQSVNQDDLFATPTGKDDAARTAMEDAQLKREIRLKPDQERLAELEAQSKANSVKVEASELQAKIQFQTMIVQMFFQRRFEHVIIACQFYQAIFGDGDQKLLLGEQIKAMLTSSSGIDPTVSVISALTHEAIQNVNDGVDAYRFMMSKGELDGATERLQEAYATGLNLPAIKTLPRSQKQLGYEYSQKSNALLDALDVKDYDGAQKLVDELQKMATDFNPTKPLAAIQTAQTISRMHLAKAKAAASQNDEKTLETELTAAADSGFFYATMCDPASIAALNMHFLFALAVIFWSAGLRKAADVTMSAWPVYLIRLYLVVVYFGSGWRKAIYGDWLNNPDTLLHCMTGFYTTDLTRHLYPVMPLFVWTLTQYMAVSFELGAPLLLLYPPLRKWGVISGCLLHIGIALLMKDLFYFSFQMLTFYIPVLTPISHLDAASVKSGHQSAT